MKKGTIILIAVIAVIAIIAFSCVETYNSLVAQRENVDTQYSAIDTQLQRRIDLIPNIVNTVKGYAAHESEVFGAVSDARARLAGASTKEEAADFTADPVSAEVSVDFLAAHRAEASEGAEASAEAEVRGDFNLIYKRSVT